METKVVVQQRDEVGRDSAKVVVERTMGEDDKVAAAVGGATPNDGMVATAMDELLLLEKVELDEQNPRARLQMTRLREQRPRRGQRNLALPLLRPSLLC